ncbi:MAG TPA: circadian clock protein KaiC [Opitutaceae bacterium]|nr:circadian clock protein KaiC [Opitutaceae bacterium]
MKPARSSRPGVKSAAAIRAIPHPAPRFTRLRAAALRKTPTGIRGLDEIMDGGLPTGRATLCCGGPGCGKTLLGVEFLVNGATRYDEPGVFLAFEESEVELAQNVAALGFNLRKLVAGGRLVIDHVRIERSEIEEAGAYNLDGLFIRLGEAIDRIGARRVVLDTIDVLFDGLRDASIVRAELRRVFQWLKQKGVTAIVTAERGENTLTRHGLEEYVSDCVIALDHRVTEQLTTRRLRVVKYRGSVHGTNEYPFLIDRGGLSVWPITSLKLEHSAPEDRVSSGIRPLDAMLEGGFHRGGSVLLAGTAGTGKTSVAATFAAAACRRGERCLYCAFEESPEQIIRNMRSIGLDLRRWVRAGRLRFHAVRPTYYGLEMHLARTIATVEEFAPAAVVLDPVSSFGGSSNVTERRNALIRLVDVLKRRNVTSLMVDLTVGGETLERTTADVSSIVDTWIVLRDLESQGERNRGLHVLKSRGTAHSNQIREFVITSRGIELREVYLGPGGILTGSARLAQEARDAAERKLRAEERDRERRSLAQKREILHREATALQLELANVEADINRRRNETQLRQFQEARDRADLALSRHATGSRATTRQREHGGVQ